MKDLRVELQERIAATLRELYDIEVQPELQATRKDFEGDLTLVVFPYLRQSRKGPEQTAQEIGEHLNKRVDLIASFNVVKGFLNFSIDRQYWIDRLVAIADQDDYGFVKDGKEKIVVEYSSPNTNKPLHLGHIRNNLLGYSVSQLLQATGKEVAKVQIINDRGIHICKSMIAWEKYGNGETPESAGMKGDKLVGKYYVEFDKVYREQAKELENTGISPDEAKEKAPILLEAREMLKKWEDGDEHVMALWNKMNSWVYDGFDETYRRLGVDFDKYYYESQTYVLGKSVVEEGLEKGVFTREEDGSVWIDLTEDGLDRKILLRSDGTSVYMTQDIGTAIQRYEDFGMDGMIYTVGNEQDYHFKVLFAILDKLGYTWAKQLYHLSYGMVDLPTGKMKSREGTVVDADDLVEEMISEARKMSEELGKTEGMSADEKEELYRMLGLGALKYFILKVDPRKRMMFDPSESIELHGNTGPYIQYTHARIRSLLKKGAELDHKDGYSDLQPVEQELVKALVQFPEILEQAAREHSPAVVANYVYDLVKGYNTLYQQLAILSDEDATAVSFRLKLSGVIADVVKRGMKLLGIQVPERM